MNKTKLIILKTLQRFVRKLITMLPVGSAVVIVGFSFFNHGVAEAALTRQLSVGSSGSDVTELQQFLATNPLIYPQRIVSGYYGQLTMDAVTQFQIAYGLPAVGRVGPLTMAKMNSVMSSGLGLDINAPILSVASISTTTNNGTITWTTNEPARVQVYYGTGLISSNETSMPFMQPSVIGGSPASSDSSLRTSHNVAVSNLQPGTTYNYLIVATDASGNVSMTVPRTFRTNP